MLTKVQDAIKALPEALQANATKLITDMTTERMGIGDNVLRWHPSILRIVQGTTNTESIDGDVKLGDIVFGNRPAPKNPRVFVLRSWESRALWDSDINKPQIICQSPDGKTGWRFGDCKKCENSKFQGDKPAACRGQKTFLAVTEDLTEIIRIDLSRTQYKIGMEWEKRLSKMSGMPFERLFALEVRRNEKNKNVYNLEPTRTDSYAVPEVSQFLGALFDYFVENRKEELKRFYDKIEDYKSRKAEEAKQESSSDEAPDHSPTTGYAEPTEGEGVPDFKM